MSEHLRNSVDLPSVCKKVSSELRRFARRRRYETIRSSLQRRIGGWSERLFARHHITYADPWADRRLIEYVMAIPQHQVFQRGQNKSIARRAMRGLMPDAALTRLQKVSPTPLYEHALKDEKSSARIRTYLTEESRFLNTDELEIHYKKRFEGREGEDFRFWLALCLNMWVQQHNL